MIISHNYNVFFLFFNIGFGYMYKIHIVEGLNLRPLLSDICIKKKF